MTKKNQEQPEEMASDVLEQTATDQETDNEAATEAVNEQAAAEKLSAELEDLNQKFLRVAADFENYKRRTNLEREDLLQYSNAKLIGELLPVIDNFALGLKNTSDSSEVQNFLKGMEMIYTQLMAILEKEGLRKIAALGEAFDPNKHEAVMQVPDDSVDEDTVIEELRAGYQFKDKILRPAIFKVSTK